MRELIGGQGYNRIAYSRSAVDRPNKATFKLKIKVKLSSPVTSLEWPRSFQEVKVSRFLDNSTG
jgi:hypothetical protein